MKFCQRHIFTISRFFTIQPFTISKLHCIYFFWKSKALCLEVFFPILRQFVEVVRYALPQFSLHLPKVFCLWSNNLIQPKLDWPTFSKKKWLKSYFFYLLKPVWKKTVGTEIPCKSDFHCLFIEMYIRLPTFKIKR